MPKSKQAGLVKRKYTKAEMNEKLSGIIKDLQKVVDNGGITQDVVRTTAEQLAELNIKYDSEKYPPLKDTQNFPTEIDESPSTLAEALLWKLGKWQVYQNFVRQYLTEPINLTDRSVVFSAFAKHLKNPDNPIFDQHVLRAMWSISINIFSCDEKDACNNFLMNTKGRWKETGSGASATACYKIYVNHLDKILNDASKAETDRLLMTLGQAIKKAAPHINDFKKMCGRKVVSGKLCNLKKSRSNII